MGISLPFIGITVAEDHWPRPVEESSRTEDVIKPLSHIAATARVLTLLNRQDHVVADLH